MLGNLQCQGWARPALFAAVIGMSIGCVRNVSGSANSGKDHKYKGAKKVKMEDDELRVRGIVTYPGGDRVDWIVFEVPEGKKGRLKFKLKWRPPRPGLDLAYNVYDQYFHRVGRAKPTKKAERTKRVKVKNVEAGKYYVQIYAPSRMDAGKYTLTASFKEVKQIKMASVEDLVDTIPDPPKLPAVPEPPKEDPNAKPPGVGPGGAPPGGVGPGGVPPGGTPPGGTPPGGDDGKEKPKEPVKAKVTNYQGTGGGFVIVTINKGKNAGVERGWAGKILKGRSAGALEGGDFKVIKVTARECIGKVRLSVDRIKRNRYVLLSPPD